MRQFEGEPAWSSADLDDGRWHVYLSAAEVSALETGAVNGVRNGLTLQEVTREKSSFPELAGLLEQLRYTLELGRGFVVFSGYPVGLHSYEENVLAFGLFAAQLGQLSAQTGKGARLIDVVDKGVPWDAEHRGYDSHAALNFHTDGADIAGLMCLSEGLSGGASFIASAAQVFNEIAKQRPDILPVLERGFHHHRRGEQAENESPISRDRLPVFCERNGLLHCCYNRNAIEWADRVGASLSEQEIDALDVLESVVNRPDIAHQHRLQAGDISFVNNYAVLHARDEYRDGEGKTRHLLRLWVNDLQSIRLGPTLQNLYSPETARYQMQ